MRAVLRVVLLLVPMLVACRGRHASTGTHAAPHVPVAQPANLEADLAIDDTKALLDGLRSQFRDPSTGVPIPADAAEILERWSALPEQVRRHIPETTRLRAVWFRVGSATRSVAAVRVRRERNAAHPLGVEIALFDGAPFGAKWVAGRPSPSAPVVALKDDVLLVADDAASLGVAVAWLTADGMTEAAGPGLRLRVPGAALGTSIRAMLDSRLEESSESAIGAARAEASNHTTAPALGDPIQFVSAVRDRARRMLAYLPDVRNLVLRIQGSANGITMDGDVDVTPGSPLARALETVQAGEPFGLRSLPVSTALAISTRRDASEMPWTDVLAAIAGPRLDADDREKLTHASEAISAMRGEASVLAIGGHPDGAFLLGAVAPGGTSFDPAAVLEIVSVPYVASALGSIVGCDEVHIASLPGGRAPLCRPEAPPYPELFVQRGPGANAVMITSRPRETPVPHAAASGLVTAPDRDTPDGLFRDPDAQRALASLGNRTIVAVALSARGIVPTLGLLGSPGLQRLGASRSLPTSAAPIVFALSKGEGSRLSARFVAPPRSVEELWAIVYLLTTLAGG